MLPHESSDKEDQGGTTTVTGGRTRKRKKRGPLDVFCHRVFWYNGIGEVAVATDNYGCCIQEACLNRESSARSLVCRLPMCICPADEIHPHKAVIVLIRRHCWCQFAFDVRYGRLSNSHGAQGAMARKRRRKTMQVPAYDTSARRLPLKELH